jgi:hypothetical protein
VEGAHLLTLALFTLTPEFAAIGPLKLRPHLIIQRLKKVVLEARNIARLVVVNACSVCPFALLVSEPALRIH